MATVYLAIQESFQREVALKIMSATLSEDSTFSQRFLQEARIVSQLIHPNIVTVHDVGIHQGHHYLSMAYVPGEELKHKLPGLTGKQILRVLTELASALDYSGKKGYVHRDVKPENILLHEEDGHAVLMDFGIARAADVASSMTMTGMALGTPHYMSPEQARGKSVDPRSDLYSLGVLMYLMLIGAVPYEAETAVAIGIKHISEPIPNLPAPLSSFQPVMSKLMAKEAKDRYQTGAELIKALALLDPAEIDRWKEANAQKPSGRRNTPVRGVKSIQSGSGKTAAETASKPAVSGTARTTTEEALHIPAEDISARKTAVQGSPRKGLWVALLLLVVAAAMLAYQAIISPQVVDDGLITMGLKPAVVTDRAEPVVAEPVAPPPEEPPPEVAVLEQLLAQSRQMASVEVMEPGQEEGLLQVYRDILEREADQPEAAAGLAVMQQRALQVVREQLPEGDLDVADEALMTALLHFPELAEALAYQDLEQAIMNQRQAREKLVLAEQYFRQDKLMAPAGENARTLYEAVLVLAPDNKEALAGLAAIAARYHQLATAARQRGDYSGAMTLVARGLSVDDDDLALNAMADELKGQINVQQIVDKLLLEAEAFEERGIWFSVDNSAGQRYQQVLTLDAGNTAALEGLQQLIDELLRQLNVQLELHNLAEAAALLQPALDILPEDAQLQEMAKLIAASQPRVDALLFSGSPDFDQEKNSSEAIQAGRTIYVRIEFSNFYQSTTVLQAVLFDGSRSIQIAAVPVILSGEQGSSSFRIDRPVEGFKKGGYHMDILLDGKRIATRAFVVAL